MQYFVLEYRFSRNKAISIEYKLEKLKELWSPDIQHPKLYILIKDLNPNLLCNPFKHIQKLNLYTFHEYAKYKGDKGEIILYAKWAMGLTSL